MIYDWLAEKLTNLRDMWRQFLDMVVRKDVAYDPA